MVPHGLQREPKRKAKIVKQCLKNEIVFLSKNELKAGSKKKRTIYRQMKDGLWIKITNKGKKCLKRVQNEENIPAAMCEKKNGPVGVT